MAVPSHPRLSSTDAVLLAEATRIEELSVEIMRVYNAMESVLDDIDASGIHLGDRFKRRLNKILDRLDRVDKAAREDQRYDMVLEVLSGLTDVNEAILEMEKNWENLKDAMFAMNKVVSRFGRKMGGRR